MTNKPKKELIPKQTEDLITLLKVRFEKNMNRHKGIDWTKVAAKLKAHSQKLRALYEMQETGGEPDVVGYEDRKSVV